MVFEELFHIKNQLGAVQVSTKPNSTGEIRTQFRLFFPAVPSADTEIASISVGGTFQGQIGEKNWDFSRSHFLTPSSATESPAEGQFWTLVLEDELPSGFYEYKYQVTFKDVAKTVRLVADPCSRYSGSEPESSGFVVGGSTAAANSITALPQRLPLRDLVVYELHIGDFTADFRGTRAPLDAVSDKLDILQQLGINAILFMPWTACKDKSYDWGYSPFQYFAVEYSYANDINQPAEKISWLKRLISECHRRDIHVIMDGVYNHCDPIFPYKYFYLDQTKCPYTAHNFGGAFPGLQDIDFSNVCTQAFIRDVCLYWISEFKIDGIRFDNTVNYYIKGDTRGLPDLLSSIQLYLDDQNPPQQNFTLTLEHLQPDAADVINTTAATSYWDNELYEQCFSHLRHGSISPTYLSSLNHIQYINSPTKAPTLYLSNHDHSSVSFQAGTWSLGPQNPDGGAEWYRTQPHAIALLTAPGTVMLGMGQDFGADFYLPESDDGHRRVLSRPLIWKQSGDSWGTSLSRLYKNLIAIRHAHSALRSSNFYPKNWQAWMTQFDGDGFGVDVARGLVVYHRWGTVDDGVLERFYIVLNFGTVEQVVRVSFANDGTWKDLLSGETVTSLGNKGDVRVGGNWGKVLFRRG